MKGMGRVNALDSCLAPLPDGRGSVLGALIG